jgi:hypothetical protein
MGTSPGTAAIIEMGEKVEALNGALNGGRGISAIRSVALALKQGDIELAKAMSTNDWDKISTWQIT